MLAQIKEPIETVYTFSEWEKEYNRRKAKQRAEKMEVVTQKLLGVGLLSLSVIGCLVFREDASGFLFTGFLGIARIIF